MIDMPGVFYQHLPRLRFTANRAIWKSWHRANLHQGTPREVACIKVLIDDALPRIQKAWQPVLANAGIDMMLQGVVCHGHPWVNFPGAAKRCELGDFLLVHDHRYLSGRQTRQATIVQAKVFHLDGVRAKNKEQLYLYTKWPRFTYETWPGGISELDKLHKNIGLSQPLPARRERDLRCGPTGSSPVTPVMIDDGCRYGMIDIEHSRWGNPQTGMNPWRLCSAQTPNLYKSKAGVTLGRYLVDLLARQAGRNVPSIDWATIVSGGCHWSLMVAELLAIMPSSPQPVTGVTYLAMTPDLSSQFGPSVSGPTSDDGQAEDGGFGIIYAQTSGGLD